MKNNLFKAVIVTVVLAVSACTKAPCEPPREEEPACNHKGKFEVVTCGQGVYNNYWIRLENGTLLQPCKSDAALLDINTVYEGMPVEVGYYGIRPSNCEDRVTCLVMLPQHEVVNITCIKDGPYTRCPDPNEGECTELGLLRNLTGELDGCGWVVDLNSGERLELKPGEVDEELFDDKTPVYIGYKRVQRPSVCMAGTTVDLTCLRVANTTTNR